MPSNTARTGRTHSDINTPSRSDVPMPSVAATACPKFSTADTSNGGGPPPAGSAGPSLSGSDMDIESSSEIELDGGDMAPRTSQPTLRAHPFSTIPAPVKLLTKALRMNSKEYERMPGEVRITVRPAKQRSEPSSDMELDSDTNSEPASYQGTSTFAESKATLRRFTLAMRIRARAQMLGLDSEDENHPQSQPVDRSATFELGYLVSFCATSLTQMPDFSLVRPPDWVPPPSWTPRHKSRSVEQRETDALVDEWSAQMEDEGVKARGWKRKPKENGSAQRKRRKAKLVTCSTWDARRSASRGL